MLINSTKKRKVVNNEQLSFLMSAEREGFEPPVPRSTTVFKTAAIDHSATSPILRQGRSFSAWDTYTSLFFVPYCLESGAKVRMIFNSPNIPHTFSIRIS